MGTKNCLAHEGDSITIHGFEDIAGKFVRIRVHVEGISFEEWTQENLTSCIKFDEDTLNKPVVAEFLKKHKAFESEFIKLNGIYYPIVSEGEFDETKAQPIINIEDLGKN